MRFGWILAGIFFGLLIGPVAALASAAPSSPVNMATVGAFLEKEQPGDAPSTATGRGTSLPSIYRIAQTRGPLGGVRDAWTKFSEDFSRTMKPYFGDLGAAKDWFAERAQLLRFNVEGTITRSKYQEPNADALEGGRLSGVFAPPSGSPRIRPSSFFTTEGTTGSCRYLPRTRAPASEAWSSATRSSPFSLRTMSIPLVRNLSIG